MGISIWGALGFMALGMALAQVHNMVAWRKYYEGRGDRYDQQKRNGR